MLAEILPAAQHLIAAGIVIQNNNFIQKEGFKKFKKENLIINVTALLMHAAILSSAILESLSSCFMTHGTTPTLGTKIP